MSSTLPTYIYKIVDGSAHLPSDVSQFPDVMELSDLDEKSGFIHLSTVSQVANTLTLFFGTHEKVFLLRIPYERVEENIRWEGPSVQPGASGDRDGERSFPHLYNGLRLGKSEVDSVRVFEKEETDSWAKALKDAAAEDWLLY